MTHQHTILTIFLVLIFVITLIVSIYLYTSSRVSSNKDAIVQELEMIAMDAFQYAMRSSSMGGGDGVFDGYTIPEILSSTANGSYIISDRSKGYKGVGKKHKGKLTIVGISNKNYGSVIMLIDDELGIKSLAFTGKFK